MADFDAGELTEFRDNWIRDHYEVVAAVDADPMAVPPVLAADSYVIQLSEYNRTRQENFFTDAQINAINASIENDWREELDAVWTEKRDERIDLADETADAETAADVQETEGRYRLIRARCREAMMEDPGFRASYTVGGDTSALDAQFKIWAIRNKADIAWVRSRSGLYNRIEVERG